jgi:hypothetical protein
MELFPDNKKLAYAFWAMCTCSYAASIATAEEYEAARIARSETIGKDVQAKLIGIVVDEQTRTNHSQAQAGELNGFFGKVHSEASRKKLAAATSKAVRHINTGTVYSSSYDAAASLGISRVLINNCCRGKQSSTMGGMMFEYVNPRDINRGVPGKSSLSKYERRRIIIELRTLIVGLNKAFPGILASADIHRISKLSTCENKRYLLSLLDNFIVCTQEKDFKEYLDDFGISKQLDDELRAILRDL